MPLCWALQQQALRRRLPAPPPLELIPFTQSRLPLTSFPHLLSTLQLLKMREENQMLMEHVVMVKVGGCGWGGVKVRLLLNLRASLARRHQPAVTRQRPLASSQRLPRPPFLPLSALRPCPPASPSPAGAAGGVGGRVFGGQTAAAAGAGAECAGGFGGVGGVDGRLVLDWVSVCKG